jgi:D-sedoheptulose 7-phosphate isomerase
MTVKNLNLTARSAEFAALIDNIRVTNLHGEKEETEESISHFVKLLQANNKNGGTIYLVGNGGSAAVASHALTDFVNACHLRAFTLHESSLITCMANDFGYEESFKLILKSVLREQDMLIAISSSGKSPNIHHAVDIAKSRDCKVITLSGFQSDNKLSKMGYLNFWLDSSDYGLVEIAHLFILHNVADRIAAGVDKGKKLEYEVKVSEAAVE